MCEEGAAIRKTSWERRWKEAGHRRFASKGRNLRNHPFVTRKLQYTLHRTFVTIR